MIKVLFTVEHFYPVPDATSCCVQNIVDQLLEFGDIEVHILQGTPFNNNCPFILSDRLILHSFSYSQNTRVSLFIKKYIKLEFPISRKNMIKQFSQNISKICSDNGIEHVYNCFFPIENVYSVKRIRNNLVSGLLMFDCFPPSKSSKNGFATGIRQMIKKRKIHSFTRFVEHNYIYIFKQTDMEDEIVFNNQIDFHLPLVKENLAYTSSKKQFIYAGAFYENLREPWDAINYIDALIKNNNDFRDYRLLIYCDDLYYQILSRKYHDSKHILINKMIPKSEIDKILSESEYLVNIENEENNLVPSKVINYFSFGKKIVNFVSSVKPKNKLIEEIRLAPNVINIQKGSSAFDDCEAFSTSNIGGSEITSRFSTGANIAKIIMSQITKGGKNND